MLNESVAGIDMGREEKISRHDLQVAC